MNKIKVNLIGEYPYPIKFVDRSSDAYKELIGSIKRIGLIQPITVRPHPSEKGMYQVIDGIARFNAFLDLGYPDIPAHVIEISDDAMAQALLVGSVRKIKTTDAQYRTLLLRLLVIQPDLKVEELAIKLGVSVKWIMTILVGKKLSKLVYSEVETGNICASNAYMLSKLTKPYQRKHLKWAIGMKPAQFIPMVSAVLRARRMK